MGVLGPDGRGVVVATADRRAAAFDTLTLRAAGIEAATLFDLGLSMSEAPEDASPEGTAAAWAMVTRRTTVAREGERLAVGRPDGSAATLEPATFSSDLVFRGAELPRRVAVFGGAWVREQEPGYGEAKAFGGRMAREGIQVVTGGYGGVMEAVCRGAAEAGGVAVGVAITAWEGRVAPNRWLTHRAEARDLLVRYPIICDADAWVAFPGGVGTLAEVALCWNLVQTSIRPRPLVVVGPPWERLLARFREDLIVTDPGDHDLVRPVPDTESAAAAVLG